MKRSRRRHRTAATFLAAVLVAVVIGPVVVGPGPNADAAHGGMLPPGSSLWSVTDIDGRRWASPAIEHRPDAVVLAGGAVMVPLSEVFEVRRIRVWLGTDRFGRDVFRLLLNGGRLTLLVAVLGTLVAAIIGGAVGFVAGSTGGWIDAILMRGVDALLAMPMLLVLVLAAAILQPGPVVLLVLLGATSWMGLARLARGQILALRERPFVLAARLSGTPWHRMWRWHYLPAVRGPFSQDLAIRLGELILAESTLSYLGLGMPAAQPTWGVMVADGLRTMTDAWWLAVVPGLAIVSVVVTLALIGEEISATGQHEAAV